jgi:hypothetical protein
MQGRLFALVFLDGKGRLYRLRSIHTEKSIMTLKTVQISSTATRPRRWVVTFGRCMIRTSLLSRPDGKRRILPCRSLCHGLPRALFHYRQALLDTVEPEKDA